MYFLAVPLQNNDRTRVTTTTFSCFLLELIAGVTCLVCVGFSGAPVALGATKRSTITIGTEPHVWIEIILTHAALVLGEHGGMIHGGMDHERVHPTTTTTTSRNMAAILQLIIPILRFRAHVSDI